MFKASCRLIYEKIRFLPHKHIVANFSSWACNGGQETIYLFMLGIPANFKGCVISNEKCGEKRPHVGQWNYR